ncbi:FecR domain-containing protein [Azorhizobium sp. AG788]|uniref:FecR family protein n=1 Tax=Azorhizobium sp. AG788 TaxID=2183897 RepID=UPI00313A3C00
MSEVPEERLLFREAADLAIRLQNDPANPVSLEMVRAWNARSPGHAAAWARVAQIHGMTGKVLGDQRRAAEGDGLLTRRNVIVGGLIGLGAAAGAWLGPQAILYANADQVTSTAEIRRVALPDGSVMTLGPDSTVAFNFSETRRETTLLDGMAFFEVARDPERPFSVLSGLVAATAIGTAFDVSSDGGYISVSVDQGIVDVRAPNSVLSQGQRLNVGDWIALDPSLHKVTRGVREASQIAAWRDGMIIAEQETVSAMVAKIARWQPGRVVLADPFLGSRVVSGVFDLSDPLRALEAVVRPFGAKVRRIGPFATVISPV